MHEALKDSCIARQTVLEAAADISWSTADSGIARQTMLEAPVAWEMYKSHEAMKDSGIAR